MTLEERIEVAAKGSFTENSWALLSEETRRNRRNIVALYLTRAFPELFTVPPTGWIAPWTIDDYGVLGSVGLGDGPEWEQRTLRSEDWDRLRDAWLAVPPDSAVTP